jgi:hypothetical protein
LRALGFAPLTDLDARGRGDAHTTFDLPIPRDGGLDELLAEAKRPGRRFDEILRGLCDAFRITISYDRTTRRVRCTAEIEAGTISHLRDRLATPHVQIWQAPPAGHVTDLQTPLTGAVPVTCSYPLP